MKSQSSSTSRKRISSEDALALWREYKATGDSQVRNRLVMTYAPLVKYIVFKKVRELPARCEVEDFISCGLEALIASIDRYDPEKGATLEQFAWTRIHGAVLDELRRQDWAPRSLRRWERDIARAREQFTGIHGRRPTREELADALSITVEDLRRREDDIAVSDVTSLNTLVISDDETTVERIDTLAGGDERLDPEHAATPRRPRTSSAAPSSAAPARARGRRAALRQEPHAARDRRDPRRLREPRLPDPLAAQAHPQGAARPTTRCSSPPSASAGRQRPQVREGSFTKFSMIFEHRPSDLSRIIRLQRARAVAPSRRPRPPSRTRRAPDRRGPAAIPAAPPPEALRGGRSGQQRAPRAVARQPRAALRHGRGPGRVIVQVRDLDGNVIRTIPPSEALDVLAGRPL